MQKIETIPKLISFILDLYNDEFSYTIDYVDASYYFSHGGCYELAKIIKHYFKDTEFVIRKDGERVGILQNGRIYDVYDGISLERLEREGIPESEYKKDLNQFTIVSNNVLENSSFGVGKEVIVNGKNVSEGIIEEISKISNIQVASYTKEEQNQIVDEKIKSCMEVMQTGLGFFGICIYQNNVDHSRFDIIDTNGIPLTHIILESDFEKNLNLQIEKEFEDSLGNKIVYQYQDNKHTFLLTNRLSLNQSKYKIEITWNDNLKPSEIMVSVLDTYFKSLKVKNSELRVTINHQVDAYGNSLDGEKREFSYRNFAGDHYVTMVEQENLNNRHTLSNYSHGLQIDSQLITGKMPREQVNDLVMNLAHHPRNKELLQFVIDSLDSDLQGIKEFILANFKLYQAITESVYQPNLMIDNIIDAVRIPTCNLNETRMLKK